MNDPDLFPPSHEIPLATHEDMEIVDKNWQGIVFGYTVVIDDHVIAYFAHMDEAEDFLTMFNPDDGED